MAIGVKNTKTEAFVIDINFSALIQKIYETPFIKIPFNIIGNISFWVGTSKFENRNKANEELNKIFYSGSKKIGEF